MARDSARLGDEHEAMAADDLLRPAVTAAPVSQGAGAELPLALRFSTEQFAETAIEYDPLLKALWCRMRLAHSPSFTPELLDDLHAVHDLVNDVNREGLRAGAQPILFYVGGSLHPDIFNVGGDLGLFLDAIGRRDRDALHAYAHSCVEAVYRNAYAFEAPVVSLVCLEGDALGGGLECALSFDHIIAERGVKLGLPEILFGSFPGMGAFNFLAQRVGPRMAEQIILGGKIYRAEECLELGIIDQLVEKGGANAAAREFMKETTRRHAARQAVTQIRKRHFALTLAELEAITDMWVEHMLRLDPQHLHRMEYLRAAQTARRANP